MAQLPVNLGTLNEMETAIQNSKADLSRISESRWKAILAKDERAALRARVEAAEKTLEGCHAIAKYVGNFSTPIAHEMERRREAVARDFENVKLTKDPWELHAWIKLQLLPLVNTTERMAHVAASSTGKMRGLDIDFHKWTGAKQVSKL